MDIKGIKKHLKDDMMKYGMDYVRETYLGEHVGAKSSHPSQGTPSHDLMQSGLDYLRRTYLSDPHKAVEQVAATEKGRMRWLPSEIRDRMCATGPPQMPYGYGPAQAMQNAYNQGNQYMNAPGQAFQAAYNQANQYAHMPERAFQGAYNQAGQYMQGPVPGQYMPQNYMPQAWPQYGYNMGPSNTIPYGAGAMGAGAAAAYGYGQRDVADNYSGSGSDEEDDKKKKKKDKKGKKDKKSKKEKKDKKSKKSGKSSSKESQVIDHVIQQLLRSSRI